MTDTFLQVTGFDPLQINAPEGAPGPAGADGPAGLGIASAAINGSNHLILTMTDSSTVDAGVMPSGSGALTLTGDVTGTGTGTITADLAAVGSAGTSGDASHTVTVTTDAKGRVTAITVNPIAIAESQVTNLTTDLAAKASKAQAIGYALVFGGI
jgi:hypothetical protein